MKQEVMKEYYGTYKMGNGTFFEAYIKDGKIVDIYDQEITEAELKLYQKIG